MHSPYTDSRNFELSSGQKNIRQKNLLKTFNNGILNSVNP